MRRARRTRRLLLSALLALAAPACAGESETGTGIITPAQLAARIESGDAPFVLDVRTPEEFAASHIPGAVNVPHDELAQRVGELPLAPSDEIVVHCDRGGRARAAEAVLRDAGFTQVLDLDGHMQAWRGGNYPVE